jgi:hypothetical protein
VQSSATVSIWILHSDHPMNDGIIWLANLKVELKLVRDSIVMQSRPHTISDGSAPARAPLSRRRPRRFHYRGMYHRPPVHNPPHAYEYNNSYNDRTDLLAAVPCEGQYDHYMNCYTHRREEDYGPGDDDTCPVHGHAGHQITSPELAAL